MNPQFDNNQAGLESPVSHSEVADTSSNDHDFSFVTRAIYVTSAGNLTIRLADDSADLTLAVLAGAFLPLRVTAVRNGSTAACVGFE